MSSKERQKPVASITEKEYEAIQDEKSRWQSSGIVFIIRQDFVMNLLRGTDGKRILDFGSGVGTILRSMSADDSGTFHGLDANARAVRLARKSEKKNLRFFLGDEKNNSLPDSYYDSIVCMEIIEHIKNEDDVIRFLKQKLKPGGSVIVTVPSRRKELKFTHFRIYKSNDLRLLFEKNGFRTTYLKSYGFPALRLSLFIFEWMNRMHGRKPTEHEVMSMYFFGGIKKNRIYIAFLPLLRRMLRIDNIFSFLDLGVGVVGRFDLKVKAGKE